MITRRLSGKPFAVSWCMAFVLLEICPFSCRQFSWPPIFLGKSLSARKTSLLHPCTMSQLTREVLTKCLSGELNCHDDDILELLSSYKCFKLPSKDNIKVLLTELAHQEIIQKPTYVAQCWYPIMSALKSDPHFCSVKSIKELFLDLSPDAKRVLKVLHPEVKSESEQQRFEFLKNAVHQGIVTNDGDCLAKLICTK